MVARGTIQAMIDSPAASAIHARNRKYISDFGSRRISICTSLGQWFPIRYATYQAALRVSLVPSHPYKFLYSV